MQLEHQRGSILIVSMVVLVLISAMAARIVYQTRLELQIQQQANALTGLRAVARGAVHQFAGFLSTHVEETSNGPSLPWWIDQAPLVPLALPAGEAIIMVGIPDSMIVVEVPDEDDAEQDDKEEVLPVGLFDAEARLNINTATPEQLMAFPGFSNVIAEAVVSYRESLVESSGVEAGLQSQAQGAESGDAAALSYVAAPFRSVHDLLQVEGVTEKILYESIAELDGAVAEFLTCCSNGRINLNTAPHPVLMGAGFSEEEANVLVAERNGGTHFKDLSIFGTVLPQIEDEERHQRLERAITVRSSTFPLMVEARSTKGDSGVKLVARVFLDESSARLVSWREI
ncbi:MAG: type II secretion system protein GspK [Arenicellales bacterium]|jgi:type II secretory pathway component PulK|nr:type II secretion system protein GspK [Arenicellales bacterium]